MNQRFVLVVSGTLVTCMIVHASEGLLQDKAPSEVHLITGAPLVAASSTASPVDYVQYNTIFDKIHMASVPQESELKWGNLTVILE